MLNPVETRPIGTPPPPGPAIDLPAFAGPLDLLLHLIERRELDITSISLAAVTEQYLARVDAMKESRVEHLIDFLVIAARLVLIKSRALLPQNPVVITGEEEEDPAEALVRQLRQYKQYKGAAAWFKGREEAGLRTYLRVAPPPRLEGKLDLSGITVETLIGGVLAALERAEQRDDSVTLVQPRRVTIEGQMAYLRAHVRRGERVGFRALLSDRINRVEVAVTLLAVLELIKRRELLAEQNELFGPIDLVGIAPEASPRLAE